MFRKYGAQGTADRLGINVRSVYSRRENLELYYEQQVTSPIKNTRVARPHPHRYQFDVPNGIVLVGSDGHYWPGIISTAHRAFVKFCEDMKPKAVIMNGDAFDGASISRHPPIGWENRPTVQQE